MLFRIKAKIEDPVLRVRLPVALNSISKSMHFEMRKELIEKNAINTNFGKSAVPDI